MFFAFYFSQCVSPRVSISCPLAGLPIYLLKMVKIMRALGKYSIMPNGESRTLMDGTMTTTKHRRVSLQ